MSTNDYAPLSVTISGELAASLRREARASGVSLADLVRHVVANLAAGDLPTDDVADEGLWEPEPEGTFVVVADQV